LLILLILFKNMIIKVLGSGCANCKKVKAMVTEAVQELGIEATMVEVTKTEDIMGYGIMRTPGVVIDEKVVHAGGVPSKQQMLKMIQDAARV